MRKAHTYTGLASDWCKDQWQRRLACVEQLIMGRDGVEPSMIPYQRLSRGLETGVFPELLWPKFSSHTKGFWFSELFSKRLGTQGHSEFGLLYFTSIQVTSVSTLIIIITSSRNYHTFNTVTSVIICLVGFLFHDILPAGLNNSIITQL